MSGDLARGDDRWQVSCCELRVNSGDRYRKLTSGKRSTGIGLAFIVFLVLCPSGIAATVSPHSATAHKPKSSQKISENQHARKRMHHLAHSRATTTATATTATASVHRRHHYYERFSTSSFAQDITEGDVTTGE